MQSITITKAMREKLAKQLTVQAVAKNGSIIAADLAALNKQFWAKHCAKVEELGLPKKQWGDLILSGTLNATSICLPHYIHKLEDGQERKRVCIAIDRDYKDDDNNELIAEILNSKDWAGVTPYIVKQRYEQSLVIELKSPTGSVPHINDMGVICDPVLESLALMICSELQKVINEAKCFRDQVMTVLMACRTSRKLEDLFPEAAKLLPQPVKNETALAPVELAASVRAMLAKGVPPVTASA